MDKKQKNSTVISLLLHLLILWAAFSLHSAQILVPSRSNGMEVSLISPEALNLDNSQPKIIATEKYHVLATDADINLKKQEKQKPTPLATPIKMTKNPLPISKPNQIKDSKARKVKKQHTTNSQLNDMLNDLTPAKNAGHSRGAALGGTNNGTSDSNNLKSNYADLVIARVRPFVILPDGLDPNNFAVVEVTLLPNMQVYKVRLLKSSGNDNYDNNVQQAISRVNVFPPLPNGASFSDYRKLKLTFRPE